MLAPVFLPEVTGRMRSAAEELIYGPLHRNGDQFCRAGHARVFRIPTVRSLIEVGLAAFDPDTKSVVATARLIDRAERFGLLNSSGAPRP